MVMDLDVNVERVTVNEDLAHLREQLSQLDQKRSQIIQQIVMRQGILQYLDSLDEHKEDTK